MVGTDDRFSFAPCLRLYDNWRRYSSIHTCLSITLLLSLVASCPSFVVFRRLTRMRSSWMTPLRTSLRPKKRCQLCRSTCPLHRCSSTTTTALTTNMVMTGAVLKSMAHRSSTEGVCTLGFFRDFGVFLLPVVCSDSRAITSGNLSCVQRERALPRSRPETCTVCNGSMVNYRRNEE